MGKLSKVKGANGERQVAALMQPIVDEVYRDFNLQPPHLERNLEQTRHGGSDLVGLDWLAVEVKWHKSRSVGAWWAQVKAAAGVARIPVLVYRGNNEPWRVVMFGYLDASAFDRNGSRVRCPVEVGEEAFLAWLRAVIHARLWLLGHRPGRPKVEFHGDLIDAVTFSLK